MQIRTKWCDSLVEHRSRTRSGNGRPTPSLGQTDRHGHKAGSSTRTRTPPGGRGISASAQLPHTAEAEGGPVSAPANHATRLRGLRRPQRRRTVLRGPRLDRCAYQHESDQEVLGGRGSALEQATGHWGGQIACPSRQFPTPMRVSYPDASLLPRCESPAPIRLGALGRAPPPGTGAWSARHGRHPHPPKGDAPVEGGARRTPRTRAHSPGPLGISARSAASRSGTS